MQDHPNSTEQSNNKGHLLDRYSVQPKQDEDKSPFYKSAAPSISLPKGGGALKGIDEKFSVNAINGTAGLEIALPLSPGRGGFSPALSLSYNSGSGNSEFGLGWALSLPAIQRRTDKLLPRYNDAAESDVFLLAGTEDLVPYVYALGEIAPVYPLAYDVKRYRPRIEGLFARIEYISKKGTHESWWRVTTKDNTATYYGLNAEGRITDPLYPGRIFKWLPQIVLDHKGNVQYFRYKAESNVNIADVIFERNRRKETVFAQRYLKQVLYCNKTPWTTAEANTYEPATPDAADFLMEAVLDYGDHDNIYTPVSPKDWPSRNDAFSDFHAGFEIRTYRKCRRVLMYHYFDELKDAQGAGKYLVRSLQLDYKNEELNPDVLSEADYIIAATQTGYDYKNGSWRSKSLPAMRFEYEALQWDTTIHTVSQEDFKHAPQGLSGPYQWTDFEGEGISGILTEQGNGWFYKNNLGEGHFESAKVIAPKPNFTGLGDGGLQWQDLDADGRRQVVSNDGAKGYWELLDYDPEDPNRLQWSAFHSFPKNANIDWNSPFTKMLDLNGDGRAEVLITEDRAWTWFQNEGTDGFSNGGNAAIFTDEEKGPMLLLRDTVQSIFLADLNGDGLTDLVRIKNGEICYWPNMGYGRFGAKVTMANAPVFAGVDVYNPIYLSFADISGTGATDLIYTDGQSCKAWVNMAGNGWGEAVNFGPLPGTDPYSKIAILDFLGNGTGCLVWSSPLPAHARAPIRYMDLMGGKKPYLMQSYHNGMGKEVSVTYKSSTLFYLDDKLEGKPWATRLPFPVHCISSVTTIDKVSATRYTQLYRYRHGYYDHEEREFRGFGYVETIDIDSATSATNSELDQAPVLTKTWNHTGAWIREDTLLNQYQKEYFQFEGWDDVTEIVSFEGILNVQESREAHRALKGSALRQEVYALDGSPQQDIPYSVTATAYTVKKIQDLAANRYASFLNYQQQSIAFSCERDSTDPRIAHSFTLETDLYGNVTHSAQVVYARRTLPALLPERVKQEQQKIHITHNATLFTNDVLLQADHYRLRLPYTAQSFEAKLDAPLATLYTLDELLALITAPVVDFTDTPVIGEQRQLSQSISLFLSNDTTTALAAGQMESLALPYESYALCFTPDIIDANYKEGTTALVTDSMLEEGGYIDLLQDGRYWLPSGTAQYQSPATRFYTPYQFTDPWGKSTTVTYWHTNGNSYWLLPQSVTDALGNTSTILAYNWRNMQALRMQDINDNISDIVYDALGMPVAMALLGKGDNTEGDRLTGLDPDDTNDPDYLDPGSAADEAAQLAFWADPENNADVLLKKATWRCVYDFDHTPVAVGMIARQQHVNNPLILTGQGTAPIIRVSYSDALGRILMHKAQCTAPADTSKNWVGSGRTIYNNKGKAVMQYEPYFSDTPACETAELAATVGVSPKMYYDPMDRLRRTELPDGTFTKTEWTAWQQSVWDNNDTVKDSSWYTVRINGSMGAEELEAATRAADHYNTPTIIHTDTLARPFYTIQHNRYPDSNNVQIDQLIDSYVNLDIQGNRIAIVDGERITTVPANDALTLQYRYNLLQGIGYQQSIDSGTQRTLTDVAGQPLYAWDAADNRFRMAYDDLRRLRAKFVGSRQFEKMVYGESYTAADPKTLNLRGTVYESFDASGKQALPDGYDFKGNPVSTALQLLSDRFLNDVDWSGAGPALASKVFTASSLFDALNRPVRSTDPGENIQEYIYDRGGALKIVRLNDADYVTNIRYDAKGQRQRINYGNNTVTRYTYDPFTFRLKQLLTTANSGADKRQDLNYYYDPVGNITRVRNAATDTLFFNNAVISPDQVYTYDALYRLVKAEGREHAGAAPSGSSDNYDDANMITADAPSPWDGTALRTYMQRCTYDKVGNIKELKHNAGTGSYTRTYNYTPDNNRLANTNTGPVPPNTPYNYSYDVRGNMTRMPHLSVMAWNDRNELYSVANNTLQAWYQYSGGQRIRKLAEKGTGVEERIYLGNFELYRKFEDLSSLTPTIERTTVHISDDTGRIAMQERRTIGSAADDHDTAEVLTRYIYSNHLQSATLELDEHAAIISYEEYHPYGTTAYQSSNSTIKAVAKRYRYTGKERDDESGLYYHGARYYIPWLARWTSIDPMESKYGGMSPYNYSFNNPVMFNDPSGMSGEKVNVAFGDHTYNVDANYYPSGAGVNQTSEFGYRWQEDGQTVVNYHDNKTDKDYSVLEQRDGGSFDNKNLYSWVNIDTGQAEAFTGDKKSFKNHRWLQFHSDAEKKVLAKAAAGEKAEKEAKQVLRSTLGYVPFVGGGLDIGEGIRDGNVGQIISGTLSLGLDIFGGAIIKAGATGIKAVIKAGIKKEGSVVTKEIVEEVTENVIKETVDDPLKSTLKESLETVDDAAIEAAKEAARIEKLAKKFKLNINSSTTKQIIEGLDETVESFISKFRTPKIRGEFPGEYLEGTVREALQSGNSTVRKLLTDNRFLK